MLDIAFNINFQGQLLARFKEALDRIDQHSMAYVIAQLYGKILTYWLPPITRHGRSVQFLSGEQ